MKQWLLRLLKLKALRWLRGRITKIEGEERVEDAHDTLDDFSKLRRK